MLKLRHFLASLVLVSFILATLASSVTIAYGHGFGTDKSFPASIGKKQVVVEASMNPPFVDQVSNSSRPTLLVRALDSSNSAAIPGVDFRIAVELDGKTLLDQRFRSSDGVVLANLVPDKDIDGWEINGKASPQEQVAVSQNNPAELKSKIFSTGGLYHIVATIETSSPGIEVPSSQKFDLYVSVGRTYNFDVNTSQGEKQMVVKTYYDNVHDFGYSNNTISFSMPFTWDPAFVAQVPVVHMEVQFPKSIKELQVNSYRGTMNGKDLEAQAVVIDDYTSEESRIVHLIVSNAMLSRVAESIKNSDTAAFTLAPAEKPKFPLDITSLPNQKYVFEMSWDPDLIQTGTPTTFVMNVQDPTTGDLIRNTALDFVLAQDGKEIYRLHRSLDFGTDSLQYTFTKAGTVTLSASNINGQGESAKIDLVVLQGTGNSTATPPQQQPSGCLIATAAFGSELTPQVQFLRNFRDHYILSTASGSAFMNTFNTVYYSFSPQVADYERGQPWLQQTVKTALYPLFGILLTAQGAYSAVEGEGGSILAGATAGSLIGAVYLWPAGFAASSKVRSRWLAIVAGAALTALAVTLAAMPALLPFSTSAFVIVAAGTSAIMAAKTIRYVHRQCKQLALHD
ncbi:MAG TPA: CFI-box-CTERM domain-containing protein [Nitrososphaera sp.]|nr:CFI-box-CTERM domain-containing protein [Nitrososphaera sp.]